MSQVDVRLLFVDEGSYHHETVRLGADAIERHERLIDALQEEPGLLKKAYLDLDRLCGAWVVEDDDA